MAATGSTPPRPGTTGVGHGAGGSGGDLGALGSPPGPWPAPPGSAPPPPPPPPTPAGPDWAAQTADAIERAIASVRGKTADPLEKIARGLVYGLVAGIVGVAALVLGAVALVRLLDIVIPGDVWSAHALTGGIFVLGGLLLWRKRTVKTVRA